MRSDRFQNLVAEHPENVMFRFSLGQALMEEGQSAEAIEHLRYCCEKKEDWMMARVFLGKAFLAQGRVAEALPILEDAHRLAIKQEHEAPEQELRALLAELRATP